MSSETCANEEGYPFTQYSMAHEHVETSANSVYLSAIEGGPKAWTDNLAEYVGAVTPNCWRRTQGSSPTICRRLSAALRNPNPPDNSSLNDTRAAMRFCPERRA